MGNIILSREEQKSIVNVILESYQDITLSEIKSNSNLKKEIQLNLKFYSGLKEVLLTDKKLKEAIHTGIGWFDGLIAGLGSIKDLLTSTDIGKWLAKKIHDLANKLISSFAKDPNDWTDKLKNAVTKFAKWLGPKSIAYMFAAWKEKSFKPSKEAIDAQMEKATKIYKVLLVVLIIIAAIKLYLFVAPFFSAAVSANISTALNTAIRHAGLSGFSIAGLNIIGLFNKIKHLSHDEGKHELEKSLEKVKDYLSHGSE
jgi:hypothetical protein